MDTSPKQGEFKESGQDVERPTMRSIPGSARQKTMTRIREILNRLRIPFTEESYHPASQMTESESPPQTGLTVYSLGIFIRTWIPGQKLFQFAEVTGSGGEVSRFDNEEDFKIWLSVIKEEAEEAWAVLAESLI